VLKHTNVSLGNSKRLETEIRSPMHKDHNLLFQENGDFELVEIESLKRKVKDSKPIVMANAILQNSKLHFLKFVYDVLWKFFNPGSLVLSYADTDSLCIGNYSS
jgi:hypothetical protein